MPGQRELHGKHYFPVLLKPLSYTIDGCMHADIDVHALSMASCKIYNANLRHLATAQTDQQYKTSCLATGISKPSIFSGLDSSATFGLLRSAGLDIMHLAALNLPDLMICLWCGTIDCTAPDDWNTWTWVVLRGDTWQQHGKSVADTLHYLPTLCAN